MRPPGSATYGHGPSLATRMPAGKGADMSELQAQHGMTPEQLT